MNLMRRKLVTLLLATNMCLGTVACGAGTGGHENSGTDNTSEEQAVTLDNNGAEDESNNVNYNSSTVVYSDVQEYFKDHDAYKVSENPEIPMESALDQIAINGKVIEYPVTFEKLLDAGFVFFTKVGNDPRAYTPIDVTNKDLEVELDEGGIAGFKATSGNGDYLIVYCDYRKSYVDICFPSHTSMGDLQITSINYTGNNCSVGGGFKTGEKAALADVQEKYALYHDIFSYDQEIKTFYVDPLVRSAKVFLLMGGSKDDPDILMTDSDSWAYSELGRSLQFGIDQENNFIGITWNFSDNLASRQMSAEYADGYKVEDESYEFYRDLDLPVITVEDFYNGMNLGKYSCAYDQKHRAVVVYEGGNIIGKLSIFDIPNAVSMKGHDFSAENMRQLTFSLIYIDGKLMGRLLDLELNELHQDWYRIESIPLYVEGGEAPASVVAEAVPGEYIPVTRNLDEYAMDAYYLTSTDIPGHYEIYTDVVESATPPRLVAYFENDETEITEMYMAEITKKDRVDPRDDRWRWEVSNGLGKAYMDMPGEKGDDIEMVYQD